MTTVARSYHFYEDDIPSTSGIYRIVCTANKKIYIGSALNLYSRRNEHFSELRRNIHKNPHLQNAWNKYGEEAFSFEVLEQVLPISLTAREQYWFNKLKPFDRKGFNINREATSWLGRKHSPKTIEDMRGKKKSPEHIEKMRQASLGNTHCVGRQLSSNTIEKIRQAAFAREAKKREGGKSV